MFTFYTERNNTALQATAIIEQATTPLQTKGGSKEHSTNKLEICFDFCKDVDTALAMEFDGPIGIKLNQLPVDFRSQKGQRNTDLTSAWCATSPQQNKTPAIEKQRRQDAFTCADVSHRIHKRDKQPGADTSTQ